MLRGTVLSPRPSLPLLLLLALASSARAEDLAGAVRGYLHALADVEEDAAGETEYDTVLVTAGRGPARAFETPAATDTVTAERIRQRSYRTLPQALRNTPNVLVQETSAGQGSPYIRGFTGFRNVFLIDGIRLNNSVFRDGPNQYWNTVDPLSLARLEVVLGPSSVLYGSDAIGGTVQAITISPDAYVEEGFGHGGRLFYRFASAENSHLGRVQLAGAVGERTGAVAGLSGKQFGDLIAGQPLGKQEEMGYDEWAGDVKVEHFLDPDTRVVLAYQHVQQNNVPRWHRTIYSKSFHGTTTGDELQRDLDQERWLVYAQLLAENLEGFVESVRASLSWHSQSEVRDRIRPPSGGGPGPNRRDRQGFDVGTLGFWVQLVSETVIGRLTYGVEVYHDDVSSFSTSNPIQGPVADDATYDLIGLFVQDVIEASERWQVILGARLDYAAADANRVSDPAGAGTISIDDDWTAVVGSARVLYRLAPDRWNVFGAVSQGFRAPNLSDLTRFDTARSNEFEIPAPGLDPEHYVSFELGLKGRSSRFAVQISTFYTIIRDQIIRFPTGDTNPDGDFEITKDNVGDGWIYGVELGGSVVVVTNWTVFGNVSWLEGKVDTFEGTPPTKTREYISRLMPLSAQVGVRWDHPEDRFWGELLVLMADKADRLSSRDAGDTQRIPPGGTPGYAVVHLRGGWRFRENAELILAVENLFDRSYRIHGSGQNMPGVNFIASATFDF